MDLRLNTSISKPQAEHQFKGSFAEDYQFLKLICPGVVDCAQYSANHLATLPASEGKLRVLEIGCGTGLSTRAFLDARDDMVIEAMDNAPTMLDQAHANLADDVNSGRLSLHHSDALAHLSSLPDESFDVIISNYAIHNFLDTYRALVIPEIARVLKSGGVFINGDRYGIDDPIVHLSVLQEEVRGYFRVFRDMDRWDLIESWVVHVLSDESLDHVMRLTPSISQMRKAGLEGIDILYRKGIDCVVTAIKSNSVR